MLRFDVLRWPARFRAWSVALLVLVGLQACREQPSPPESETSSTASVATAPGVPAAASSPTVAPKAPVGSTARPFLYEVSKGEASGHLLGTMHMGGDPDDDLHPIVWKRFEKSPMVVIEADLGGANPVVLVESMQLPVGEKLSGKLEPAAFQRLKETLGPGPTPMPLERMKPHAAMSLLVQQMVPKTRPMDLVIQSRAKRANKRMGYLESIEEQLELLEEAIDVEALAFSLEHLEEMKERLGQMSRAYLGGDEKALVTAVFDPEEMEAQPEMFEQLFESRNEAWMKKLPGFFDEGAFVAVGAGHLLGEDSLVAMLRDAGWNVERVVVDP